MFEKKKAKCDMGEGRSKNLILPVSTFRMPMVTMIALSVFRILF